MEHPAEQHDEDTRTPWERSRDAEQDRQNRQHGAVGLAAFREFKAEQLRLVGREQRTKRQVLDSMRTRYEKLSDTFHRASPYTTYAGWDKYGAKPEWDETIAASMDDAVWDRLVERALAEPAPAPAARKPRRRNNDTVTVTRRCCICSTAHSSGWKEDAEGFLWCANCVHMATSVDEEPAPRSQPRKRSPRPQAAQRAAQKPTCTSTYGDTGRRCQRPAGHRGYHKHEHATGGSHWPPDNVARRVRAQVAERVAQVEQVERARKAAPARKAQSPAEASSKAEPAPYFGSKNRLYHRIINLIPQHSRFVELFGGSAAVSRHLARGTAEALVYELDPEQVAWLKARSELVGHRIQCDDALLVLERGLACGWGPETVIFADPPYPMGDRREARRRYKFEFTEAQHARLLELLGRAAAQGCRVLICGHPWGLYATALQGWRKHEFTVVLRRGGRGVECVWTSYHEDPFPLHDYRYYGADKRLRQDLRRRVTRQLELFRAMDKHARAAILRELAAAFPLEAGAPRWQAPTPAVDDVISPKKKVRRQQR